MSLKSHCLPLRGEHRLEGLYKVTWPIRAAQPRTLKELSAMKKPRGRDGVRDRDDEEND